MTEMDVLVDARAPVLEAVLKWIHSNAGGPKHHPDSGQTVGGVDSLEVMERPAIIFDTNSDRYFASVKAFLKPLGYDVLNDADMYEGVLARREERRLAKETVRSAFVIVASLFFFFAAAFGFVRLLVSTISLLRSSSV